MKACVVPLASRGLSPVCRYRQSAGGGRTIIDVERASDGAALAVVPTFGDRRCVVCREPLADGYWIVAYPDGAHERCIDWSRRPFPYARQVGALSRIARAAEVARPDLLRRAARALAALEERWPDDALFVLDRGRVIIAAARRFTGDAPPKVRALL